jgi:ribosomal protein L15
MNAAFQARYFGASPHMTLIIDAQIIHRFRSATMTQNTDVQGLQSRAEARLASLKQEKLVTRIAVLPTLLGQGKITERLMIGMSVETHKTSPDFDQKKCNQAKSRIMQALGEIDCDVFIEMDR